MIDKDLQANFAISVVECKEDEQAETIQKQIIAHRSKSWINENWEAVVYLEHNTKPDDSSARTLLTEEFCFDRDSGWTDCNPFDLLVTKFANAIETESGIREHSVFRKSNTAQNSEIRRALRRVFCTVAWNGLQFLNLKIPLNLMGADNLIKGLLRNAASKTDKDDEKVLEQLDLKNFSFEAEGYDPQNKRLIDESVQRKHYDLFPHAVHSNWYAVCLPQQAEFGLLIDLPHALPSMESDMLWLCITYTMTFPDACAYTTYSHTEFVRLDPPFSWGDLKGTTVLRTMRRKTNSEDLPPEMKLKFNFKVNDIGSLCEGSFQQTESVKAPHEWDRIHWQKLRPVIQIEFQMYCCHEEQHKIEQKDEPKQESGEGKEAQQYQPRKKRAVADSNTGQQMSKIQVGTFVPEELQDPPRKVQNATANQSSSNRNYWDPTGKQVSGKERITIVLLNDGLDKAHLVEGNSNLNPPFPKSTREASAPEDLIVIE